ncbi:hypothetical protein MILUP08_42957 [Micromonospora lupini str. Lupac 08]|uniref:Uncharacterized protein n=1 Tax=Micromonospora lupini str. Lupac 08 TaxID=1150864 RepID=I0L2I0_9ACTN|nr:hypothetical protein MILUP08_42957 [Micromonospora lupini str. Lupac 08]
MVNVPEGGPDTHQRALVMRDSIDLGGSSGAVKRALRLCGLRVVCYR